MKSRRHRIDSGHLIIFHCITGATTSRDFIYARGHGVHTHCSVFYDLATDHTSCFYLVDAGPPQRRRGGHRVHHSHLHITFTAASRGTTSLRVDVSGGGSSGTRSDHTDNEKAAQHREAHHSQHASDHPAHRAGAHARRGGRGGGRGGVRHARGLAGGLHGGRCGGPNAWCIGLNGARFCRLTRGLALLPEGRLGSW